MRDSAFCAGVAAEVWLDEHDDGVLKLSHYHYKIMIENGSEDDGEGVFQRAYRYSRLF